MQEFDTPDTQNTNVGEDSLHDIKRYDDHIVKIFPYHLHTTLTCSLEKNPVLDFYLLVHKSTHM
jgi:hypothetical protein